MAAEALESEVDGGQPSLFGLDDLVEAGCIAAIGRVEDESYRGGAVRQDLRHRADGHHHVRLLVG